MELGLKGLKLFITAGASGIGRQIVESFLSEGADVSTCDIDNTALAELRAAHPSVSAHQCDVSNSSAMQALIKNTADEMGGLDCLVNNAGIAGPTARIEDIDDEAWHNCVNICLSSQFYCIKAALPYLRDSKNASIVNLSSAAGKFGFPLRSPYAAAKWGVVGLTKTLSIELGQDNVRVNAILPGLVDGDRIRRVIEAKSQQRGLSFADVEAEALSFSSIKDYVSPKHLADQILLLASTRGRMISGQALSIDGDTKMLV